MKRTSLTTAVIAGLAGVVGIANMAGAVNLSTDGTGSVLIYPYYTVNANNVTLLSVVNTTSEGKAVKVRNSREVLDFNLYMSPYDVWTAEVDPLGAGAGVTTADNSCTVPKIVGSTIPFVNYAYSGANKDTGPSSLSRTLEGYVEMIEMGTVTNATKGSLTAITHVNGVPASCGQVQKAWAYGASGAAAYWNADPTIDIGPADGGLFGSGTIVNVAQGTIEGYNADALEGFYVSGTFDHQAPGSVLPNLNDSSASITAFTFNTSGMGGVSLATTSFSSAIDAVSAVFMTNNVYNEYVVDPAYGESTEWVVTFPTKRFYVDPQIVSSTVVKPFDVVFGSSSDGTSCSPVSINVYDREEGTSVTQLGFSPPKPGQQGPVLCYEANVITFNQGGASSTVLGSNLVSNIDVPNGAIAGWANLGFASAQHELAGSNGNTFSGLPAVGFSVQQTINANAAPGVLANYTALYNHKYNRVCNNGQAACS